MSQKSSVAQGGEIVSRALMSDMALPAAQFDAVRPRLELWLGHVFQVMSGYVLATGVLTITLAATSFRAHHWAAALGALIGGAASIVWMAYVNFAINSDFKWVLFGIALLWARSLILFWIEKHITMLTLHPSATMQG